MSVMMPPGLAMHSTKIAWVLGVSAARKRSASVVSAKRTLPVEFLEGVGELVDRAAIELARGDELVARLHERMEDERLRRVARGDGERRRAAFERRDALLEHGLGRVHDARIDVAEDLEIEQRRRVIGAVEHEGRGLVDRRDPRAGGGIGLRAGMNGQSVEAGLAVCRSSWFPSFC